MNQPTVFSMKNLFGLECEVFKLSLSSQRHLNILISQFVISPSSRLKSSRPIGNLPLSTKTVDWLRVYQKTFTTSNQQDEPIKKTIAPVVEPVHTGNGSSLPFFSLAPIPTVNLQCPLSGSMGG